MRRGGSAEDLQLAYVHSRWSGLCFLREYMLELEAGLNNKWEEGSLVGNIWTQGSGEKQQHVISYRSGVLEAIVGWSEVTASLWPSSLSQ